MVKEELKVLEDSLGIRYLHLPAYSPELNLIERYWAYAKKHYLKLLPDWGGTEHRSNDILIAT
jgi:transposase